METRIEAAETFYLYVKNYRADSMKEVVNLYIEDGHKRRMELAQQQMIENQNVMQSQLRLNNILAVGNLVMQAGLDVKIRTLRTTSY